MAQNAPHTEAEEDATKRKGDKREWRRHSIRDAIKNAVPQIAPNIDHPLPAGFGVAPPRIAKGRQPLLLFKRDLEQQGLAEIGVLFAD